LLLGLLLERGGIAEILTKAGLTAELVTEHLRTVADWPEQTNQEDGMIVGRSATLAFERAQAEASKGRPPETRIHFVGLRHLVLALLDEDSGVAADILNHHEVYRDDLRQAFAY
jgi:ATP-dependent Clp protease ATP-binding subunit ClpA